MPVTRKTRKPLDPWMSLVEAAKALGETRQTVLTRAIKGEVEAKHIAGRTVVSRESVARALKGAA
jgi:hypothetical protein